MYPDFIGIGAQKAGTTWLARNLAPHPEIHMPRKEVHYFDRKIREKSNAITRFLGKTRNDEQWRRHLRRVPSQLKKDPSFEQLRWNYRFFFRPYDDLWYSQVFEPKKGKISGEITPAYSAIDRERVAHVHELMPDAKILFMMRSPIERPWSAMDMRTRIRGESIEELKDRKFYRRFDGRGSRLRTEYSRTLENWGAFYPQDQLFVGFLEDVHLFPERLLKDVYAFLGVDPTFEPPGAGRKVHSGKQETIPTRFAVHLAKGYRDEIQRLADRFGGHASFWLYGANRLIEDPPDEEHIPYPLYASPLWEEWTAGNGPGPDERPRYSSGTFSL